MPLRGLVYDSLYNELHFIVEQKLGWMFTNNLSHSNLNKMINHYKMVWTLCVCLN